MSTMDLEQIVEVTDEAIEELSALTHIVTPAENQLLHDYLVAQGNPNPDGRDIVYYAKLHGWEVKALCGYVWIPSRDVEKYDTCPECLRIAHERMENG